MPTVLVVDDDPDIRVMLEVYLTLEGFDVVTACNGREALRHLADHHAALILLDLMMPVMDGVEFRRQQQRDPGIRDIPVVCVSARYDASQLAEHLGVAGCLVKPFDVDTVIAAVRRFCSQTGR
jgi:CheY-like chemotaxis protein